MSAPPTDHAALVGVPLFVDLDGTLVRTDVLYECFLDRLKRDWLLPLRALAWLCGGTAALKTRLAEGHALAAHALPYNDAVLAYIAQARAAGRPVYLATASHRFLAAQVAGHVGLFDGVIASEPGRNVSGRTKLARLRELTGSDRFEYLGNGRADLAIWGACAHAGVVAPDPAARRWLARHPGKAHAVDEHMTLGAERAAQLRALRPRLWLKNLLLALPLVAAHRVLDPQSVLCVVLAFVAFCLGDSALHVGDDLLDLDADRAHPGKRMRPFASGTVPVVFGLHAAPLLVLAACGIGALVSWAFVGALALYLAIALAYSQGLKRKRGIGVLTLAGLYTMRIAAGAVAIELPPSHWLLGFSAFLFFGLALVKRSSELARSADAGRPRRIGRRPWVDAVGIASGCLSVLVLASYVGSPSASRLYAHPSGLWLLCALLVYWLGRLWRVTRRGGLHEDPVVYAARDGVSRAVAVCGLLVMLASTPAWRL